jgi:hypothetical protein
MIGALLDLITLRRFYHLPPTTQKTDHSLANGERRDHSLANGERRDHSLANGERSVASLSDTETIVKTKSTLDPNREASDLSVFVNRAIKICDRMALIAVEDAIFLMERLYVEQFGPQELIDLNLTAIKGRLGRIYDIDDHERYDDSVLVDRVFERYDDLISSLDRNGDLQAYRQADVNNALAILREVELLSAYLSTRGLR